MKISTMWLGMGLAILAAPALAQDVRKPGEYPPTADSLPQPGVPHGKLIGPLEFRSKIIADTVRATGFTSPSNTMRRIPRTCWYSRMANVPPIRRDRSTFLWCWTT
ncbi:MAG TPA: hypothetical protein VHZ32_05975 [Rhizomicrobium sp.]|nr:hypothetical protein [Rhizomicrobium sp.]